MQAILVLAVVALASADVSHLGYHYKVPQTSYGVPSYQGGSSSGQYHSVSGNSGPGIYKGAEGQYLGSSFSHGDQGIPSHLTGDAQLSASSPSGDVTTGLGNGVSGSNFGLGSSTGFGSSSGFGSGLNGGSGLSSGQYYQTVGGPSTVQPIFLSGSNQYQTTQYQSGEKYQQFYQVQSNEPAQVYKHFYVHSAPEELELPKPRTPIVVPPPQKHYKIIFVKTPNPASHSSQIVPVQPQNEEKTIVYVLVKKPEEHREVIVPKVEQKPPTKPEVYFIKYNNKEDSQAVINNIVNDYNKPGQSVSFSTGSSEGSPVFSGLPSAGPGYVSGSSSLSDVPSYTTIPSGGFSNGFSKYPSGPSFSSVPSGSNFGSTFSNVPSSVGSSFPSFSGIPTSLSTGSSFSSLPNDILINKFDSSSGSSSGLSGGSNSGLSSDTSSGIVSGSGLSSLFGSSQSDSSVAPVSSHSLDVSTPEASDSGNDAGAEASSVFSGVSSPSVSTVNSVSGTQGLPHETYGVPKFRIV